MKKLLIFVLVIFISGCSSEINGSSAVKWLLSIAEVAKENNKPQDQLLFAEALSRMVMLSYAENNPSFNKLEYQKMAKNDAEGITRELSNNPVVMMDVMKKTDGMDFDDVIDAGNDANEELNKILAERPVTVAIAPPIQTQPETIKPVPVASNVVAPVVPATQTEIIQTPPAETASAPIETSPLPASVEQPAQNLQPPADSSQTQQEKEELARYKAKDALDEANKQINIVWNAPAKDIRKVILPEQKEWLNQRENDCGLKASNEEQNNTVVQETTKFNCMAVMTNERTEVLKQKIAGLQSSSPLQKTTF